MRVAVYDPYLDTLGGGEKYILAICSNYLKNGHSVDILFDKDLNLLDIKKRFNLPLEGLSLVKINLNSLGLLAKYQFLRKYDHYLHLSDGSIPIPMASKNYIHFQVPFSKIKPTIIDKIKLKLFDSVIVNSKFTKKVIDNTYSVNSEVLYPPVTLFKKLNKKNIIISIGRFDAVLNSKRQDILIEAFKILSKKNRHFSLYLVGGISDKDLIHLDQLKSKARGYKIKFFPNLSFTELSKLISESKVYWHATGFECKESDPEYFEHFGISILEASSSGSVPIVYDGGGPKEYILEKNNGLFFTTAEMLAVKTLELISNPKLFLQMSKSAQTTAKKYSVSEFNKNVEKIFS